MLPSLSQPPPSPHLVRVCLQTLSLVVRGSLHFLSPTLPLTLTFSPTPPIPLASLPNPPLQVYWWSRDRCVISYSPDITCPPFEVPAPSSSPLNTDDLPIALWWGKHTCTQHPTACFVSYDRISSCLHLFACALSSISIPSSYKQALLHLDGSMLWMRKWVRLTRKWPKIKWQTRANKTSIDQRRNWICWMVNEKVAKNT